MVLIHPGRAFETNDDDIASAVKFLIDSDKYIPSEMIQVHSSGGIVTLAGFVDSILDQECAVEIAKTARGVRSVVNLIRVIAENRSDKLIRKDLRLVFGKDFAADSFKINTSVDNGIVTLSGRVESWQEKSTCARIAKSVKGVKAIRIDIDVRPVNNRTDDVIEAEIRRLLRWDVRVDESEIKVNVVGGRVTLSGSVGSIGEKTQVFRNAWVAGVISVEDKNLRVKSSQRSAMVQDIDYMLKSREEIKRIIEDTLSRDPRVTPENLQIDVDISSAVTLHGFVKNRNEKIAAEQDAKNTIGVLMVHSNLKIQPSISAESLKVQERNADKKRTATHGS